MTPAEDEVRSVVERLHMYSGTHPNDYRNVAAALIERLKGERDDLLMSQNIDAERIGAAHRQLDEYAETIDNLRRERDEFSGSLATTIGKLMAADIRAEAAESQLTEARRRIAELEGRERAAFDAGWNLAKQMLRPDELSADVIPDPPHA